MRSFLLTTIKVFLAKSFILVLFLLTTIKVFLAKRIILVAIICTFFFKLNLHCLGQVNTSYKERIFTGPGSYSVCLFTALYTGGGLH